MIFLTGILIINFFDKILEDFLILKGCQKESLLCKLFIDEHSNV